MRIRRIATITMSACALASMFAMGCSEQRGSASSPLAPQLQKGLASTIAREPAGTYDARLDEIKLLASQGDVAGAADATNALLSAVSDDVTAGRVTSDAGLEVAQQAQQAVAGVHIDVHFGSDQKCDAQFNCAKAQQMCVSVTWHVDGVGGGRNCYNWGGQSN